MLTYRWLPVLVLLSPPASADTQHYLLFRAQPAVAEISGSDTREKSLPTLEFPFRLDAACATPAELDSVSLSVADIRKSWSASDAAITVEESLIVPARQTSPVMADFCIAEDDGVTQLVRSVLTAQIALKCSVEGRRSVEYRSASLDVELACRQLPAEESADESSEFEEPADVSTSS